MLQTWPVVPLISIFIASLLPRLLKLRKLGYEANDYHDVRIHGTVCSLVPKPLFLFICMHAAIEKKRHRDEAKRRPGMPRHWSMANTVGLLPL